MKNITLLRYVIFVVIFFGLGYVIYYGINMYKSYNEIISPFTNNINININNNNNNNNNNNENTINIDYQSTNTNNNKSKNDTRLDNYPHRKEKSSIKIPVLIITYQRANNLQKCLNTIELVIDNSRFDVFVSQDGTDKKVESVIKEYVKTGLVTKYFQKRHNDVKLPKGNEIKGYYYLSQHYKFAISSVFDYNKEYDRILIIEEDLEVAIDFFEYFYYSSYLLDKDKSIFCISAFNDNGMKGYVKNPTHLLRSDFFPGLGWMMSRDLYKNELESKWPLGYWDEFMRLDNVRKDRSCIRPEIPRIFHHLKERGVSMGQFSSNLKNIQINKELVDWGEMNLDYLIKGNYDVLFEKRIQGCILVKPHEIVNYNNKDLKIIYHNKNELTVYLTRFKLMPDFKNKIPRTAYQGVIFFVKDGNNIFLVPSKMEFMKYSW